MTGRSGFILLLTMMLMLILTAVGGGLILSLTTDYRGAVGEANRTKAFWLAEAGLADVIFQLLNDSSFRTTPTTVTANLGSGSYSVTVSKSSSTYTLTATGTVDAINRRITESVVVTATSTAFNFVQQTEKNIDFKDSSGTITGDLNAKEVKNESGMTITGTITESSSIVNPTVDFSGYAGIADNTVNGNKTFDENQTFSGVWYVDGSVTIETGVTINGSVIATGKITIKKKAKDVTIAPTSPNPALISGKDIKAGELKDSSISGLIFADGKIDFSKNQNNTFTGAMVAGKDINITDGSGLTITYDPDLATDPPPFFSGGASETVTATEQKDWDEIAAS